MPGPDAPVKENRRFEKWRRFVYPFFGSAETEKLNRICDALPEGKRTEVTDFARFLLARESEDAWERILGDPGGHPKLDVFVKEALAEGSETLDLDRLWSKPSAVA